MRGDTLQHQWICWLTLVILGMAWATRAEVMPARLPLESLQYRIRLGPITVGTASLETIGLAEVDGRGCTIIRYTARSGPLLGAVYPVRDRITSLVDTLDFRCHHLSKSIREGSYREHRRWKLDHDEGHASDERGILHPIAPGSHDVFSALQRLRHHLPSPGQVVSLPVFLGGASDTLHIGVGKPRVIEGPLGTFSTLPMEPILGGGGPFRHEGPVIVDVTLDQRRWPVRITVQVPVVGKLVIELTRITPHGKQSSH